jgi:hypothetical protein
MHIVAEHDAFLVKRLGGNDPADVADLLPRIKAAVEHLNIPKTAWVIKGSAAKRLLKASPPKKVMNQLGYRSLDSMLKRENICEIYGALRFAESAEWMEKFLKSYKKLQTSDFETRVVEVIQLDPKRWGMLPNDFIRQNRHNVTHSKEMGVVLILPMPMQKLKGITITLLPMLLHYINEIRLYSAYFKMQQIRPNFGEILADTLAQDPAHHAVMAGQHIHWRVIHRYFGNQDVSNHPEFFEPHVQPEDLIWHKAEEVLYRLEPALHFWHDMDYVGINLGGQPVSFNLMDMAVSYVNNLQYGQHTVHHFRDSLWNEIYIRYLGQKSLEFQVLKQLDNVMVGI